MLLPLVLSQAITMQDIREIAVRPAQRDALPHVEASRAAEPTPGFIGRVSFGLGPPMPSAQQALMAKEGYTGWPALGLLDAAGRVYQRLLLGGFVAGTLRDSRPSGYDGPDLSEKTVFVGGEGMLLAGDGSCRFPLVARLGYARGGQSFHGSPRGENAPVFGAEVGLLCLHFPVGAAAGMLFAPAPPPGDLGRSWNMGLFHVSVVVDLHN